MKDTKAILLGQKQRTIVFTNYNRIPESKIMSEVLAKLQGLQAVNIGDKREMPFSEVYYADFKGSEFQIINDYDYGTLIKSNSLDLLKELTNKLNS